MTANSSVEPSIFDLVKSGDIAGLKAKPQAWLKEHLEDRDRFERTPIMLAAFYGHRNLFDLFAELGADQRVEDDEGVTMHEYMLHFGIGRALEEASMSMQAAYLRQMIRDSLDEAKISKGARKRSNKPD